MVKSAGVERPLFMEQLCFVSWILLPRHHKSRDFNSQPVFRESDMLVSETQKDAKKDILAL